MIRITPNLLVNMGIVLCSSRMEGWQKFKGIEVHITRYFNVQNGDSRKINKVMENQEASY